MMTMREEEVALSKYKKFEKERDSWRDVWFCEELLKIEENQSDRKVLKKRPD
jgi:hypothetical protein